MERINRDVEGADSDILEIGKVLMAAQAIGQREQLASLIFLFLLYCYIGHYNFVSPTIIIGAWLLGILVFYCYYHTYQLVSELLILGSLLMALAHMQNRMEMSD